MNDWIERKKELAIHEKIHYDSVSSVRLAESVGNHRGARNCKNADRLGAMICGTWVVVFLFSDLQASDTVDQVSCFS